ncbi:MAG: 7-cyano-7-deazaguanine synthase QueC [Candidatus Hadarchaeales archaeon]
MKAICLLSGGPDSAVAAALARREGYEIYCLSFDYGQRARRELESARKIARSLGAREHRIVDLSSMKEILGRGVTPLVDGRMGMPEKFEKSLIVPFRNGIMLAVAAGHAVAIGASAVFYGAQGDDAAFYPDCRDSFARAMEKAIGEGTGEKIKVVNPLVRMKKSQVIRLADELGVPLEETWSCYLDGRLHCGRCESCRNRKRAFEEAGIRDPTKYLE